MRQRPKVLHQYDHISLGFELRRRARFAELAKKP